MGLLSLLLLYLKRFTSKTSLADCETKGSKYYAKSTFLFKTFIDRFNVFTYMLWNRDT